MKHIAILFPLMACTNTKNDTSEEIIDAEEFDGGNFQLTNSSVEDQCLDGAFTVLFLPDGTEHDWAFPIELPAEVALPATYNIQLEEPFSTMEVTVSSGGSSGSFVIENAIQEDVLFNADAYPDCIVDLSIEATLIATDSDNLTGQATLRVMEHTGDSCPVFTTSPCDILLDFFGSRL